MEDFLDEDFNKETIVLGGGCFWCTEAVFKMLKGVVSVEPGYAREFPTNQAREEVTPETIDRVEVVRVVFDPKEISFENLLAVFFASHDPTTSNCQGDNVGPQYRSAIFYTTKSQEKIAKRFIEKIDMSETKGRPIITHVGPLKVFLEAENSQKDYCRKHREVSYCQTVINSKLEEIKKKFPRLLKDRT